MSHLAWTWHFAIAAGAVATGAAAVFVGDRGLLACVAVVAVAVGAVFPRQAGVGAFLALAIVGAAFNPVVSGSAAGGRVYLSAGLIAVILVASVGVLLLNRGAVPRFTVPLVLTVAAYVAVIYRTEAEGILPWLYKPLQPILLAAAVGILLSGRPVAARRVLQWILVCGAVGAALGVAHAIVPTFDPFAMTRPDDIPFEARVLFFARASGGLVYPNVFGLFCAYLTIAALSARADRLISRSVARWAVFAGIAGVLTSTSRAALGGLVLAVFYLIVTGGDAATRVRRGLLALFATVATYAALMSTETGSAIFEDRFGAGLESSAALRTAETRRGFEAFIDHPFIGMGLVQSRLDNGILLYLMMGGLLGFVLLCYALVLVSRSQVSRRIPHASMALLLVLLGASLLQDSIGQTLSSYLLGACLGLFAIVAPVQSEAEETPSRPKARVGRVARRPHSTLTTRLDMSAVDVPAPATCALR